MAVLSSQAGLASSDEDSGSLESGKEAFLVFLMFLSMIL